MAVAVLFGEKESTEQVSCVVSSMHRACPAYPQLLTYRRGAANRHFGPAAEVAPTVEPTLRAIVQHCASTLTFSQQVVHESRRDG